MTKMLNTAEGYGEVSDKVTNTSPSNPKQDATGRGTALAGAVSEHTATSKNTKATLQWCYMLHSYVWTILTWAVSQHTDTSKNTSSVLKWHSYVWTILTWAVSQHMDTSKKPKATLK